MMSLIINAHTRLNTATPMGNSAGSPEPSRRPLPAIGYDADILDV